MGGGEGGRKLEIVQGSRILAVILYANTHASLKIATHHFALILPFFRLRMLHISAHGENTSITYTAHTAKISCPVIGYSRTIAVGLIGAHGTFAACLLDDYRWMPIGARCQITRCLLIGRLINIADG